MKKNLLITLCSILVFSFSCQKQEEFGDVETKKEFEQISPEENTERPWL